MFCAFTREWLEGDVAIAEGRFAGVGSYEGGERIDGHGRWLSAGFIDAHMHVESCKLSPAELARVLLARGTTTIVCDPHELANVLGPEGVHWFVDACDALPLEVLVFAPSAVPASSFESPRTPLSLQDVAGILARDRVIGLAEMMNYPAVIAGVPEELAKIELAGGKRIDGHAPGVAGSSPRRVPGHRHQQRPRGDGPRARRWRNGGAARGCCCARPRTPATCAICCRSCASTGPSAARSAPTTASPTSSCAKGTSTRCAAWRSRRASRPRMHCCSRRCTLRCVTVCRGWERSRRAIGRTASCSTTSARSGRHSCSRTGASSRETASPRPSTPCPRRSGCAKACASRRLLRTRSYCRTTASECE